RPVLAMAPSETAGADGAHVLAMHELVVHVEEVFVHERVVACHLAIEAPGLVVAPLRGPEAGGQASFGQGGVAGEDENEAIHLADRVRANTVRDPLPTEVWHVDALAAAIVSPAVVMALQAIAMNHPEVQRHLPMRAAILERDYSSARATIERDGIPREMPSQYPPRLELIGPRQRIPVIGIRGGTPQVHAGRQIGRQRGSQNRMVVRHQPRPHLLSEVSKITPFPAASGGKLCDRYRGSVGGSQAQLRTGSMRPASFGVCTA